MTLNRCRGKDSASYPTVLMKIKGELFHTNYVIIHRTKKRIYTGSKSIAKLKQIPHLHIFASVCDIMSDPSWDFIGHRQVSVSISDDRLLFPALVN